MKKTTIAIILVILLGTGGYAVYKNINAKAASASSTSQYTEAKASVQNIHNLYQDQEVYNQLKLGLLRQQTKIQLNLS